MKEEEINMPLSFDSEEAYIKKMMKMMKYENRDPKGKRLFKLKIEGDCTFLPGANFRGRGGRQ